MGGLTQGKTLQRRITQWGQDFGWLLQKNELNGKIVNHHFWRRKPCVYRGFQGWRLLKIPSPNLHHDFLLCSLYNLWSEWSRGEGWVKVLRATFTSRNPYKHRGFRVIGEGWRKKHLIHYFGTTECSIFPICSSQAGREWLRCDSAMTPL